MSKANYTPLKKADEIRRRKLLSNGREPRWVRCYDFGNDDVTDRYTAVFTGNIPDKTRGWFPYVGMSEHPFHPQGFGMHGENPGNPVDAPRGKWPPEIGRRCHLGTRIEFSALPPDCRKLVMDDYFEMWDIKGPKPEDK